MKELEKLVEFVENKRVGASIDDISQGLQIPIEITRDWLVELVPLEVLFTQQNLYGNIIFFVVKPQPHELH